MATSYNVALRNAQMDAITTFAGSGAKLRIYSGSIGTTTTMLAEFTLGSPFAPAASNGVLSPTLPSNTAGTAAASTGTTAGWFRIVKADGSTQVIDGTAGTSGTDLILNTATISSGVAVSITGFTITRGNP